MDEIARKDVRIGDTVIVRRAGDVIPEVKEVVLAKRPKTTVPLLMIEHCPVCGSEVKKDPEGPIYRCIGRLVCKEQLQQSLQHFVSRREADIEGLGESVIAALVERELLRTQAELSKLATAHTAGPYKEGGIAR